eukprot:5456484-Lingulodinium_polyedra.AAC.1
MGLGITGARKVECNVVEGKVQLDDLLRPSNGPAMEVRSMLDAQALATQGEVALADLLVAMVPKKGSGPVWLVAQLLHCTGLAVDAALMGVDATMAHAPEDVQTCGPRRKADVGVAIDSRWKSRWITDHRRLGKHALC